MGMRMPETCWAVFKRQVINLRICCVLLADSVETMMMHGIAKLKFPNVAWRKCYTASKLPEHLNLCSLLVQILCFVWLFSWISFKRLVSVTLRFVFNARDNINFKILRRRTTGLKCLTQLTKLNDRYKLWFSLLSN